MWWAKIEECCHTALLAVVGVVVIIEKCYHTALLAVVGGVGLIEECCHTALLAVVVVVVVVAGQTIWPISSN